MADLENQEIETDDNQEIDNPETEPQPSNDSQDDDITYEQALEWKAKAERLEKAEKRIEKLKSQQKIQKTQVQTGVDEKGIKSILQREKFFDKNPDAEPYRTEIEKLEQKGLSIEDAYYLASKKDREVDRNREVYGNSLVGGDTGSDGLSPISIKEFDSMTPTSQNEYIDKMTSKYGKVSFK